MTREEIAAMAMQGFLASNIKIVDGVRIVGDIETENIISKWEQSETIAKLSVLHADALLEELSKPKDE